MIYSKKNSTFSVLHVSLYQSFGFRQKQEIWCRHTSEILWVRFQTIGIK